jgi:hypothetical protein
LPPANEEDGTLIVNLSTTVVVVMSSARKPKLFSSLLEDRLTTVAD